MQADYITDMFTLEMGMEKLHQFVETKTDNCHSELIVCSCDEVYIWAIVNEYNDIFMEVWSWQVAKHPSLPIQMKDLLKRIAECKPIDNGNNILITSAGSGAKLSSIGAVALVKRSDGSVIFSAMIPNPHSADALPYGRIAIASSVADGGNRIIILERSNPERFLWSDDVYSCHGVVWDEKRELVWVLGYDQLRSYTLHAWGTYDASLSHRATYALPDKNGHDLCAIPNSPLMIITTSRRVFYFDREKQIFWAHPFLAKKGCVKSTSVNGMTGQLAYVQSEGANWWSEKICFWEPERVLFMKGMHLYKARWNVCETKHELQ